MERLRELLSKFTDALFCYARGTAVNYACLPLSVYGYFTYRIFRQSEMINPTAVQYSPILGMSSVSWITEISDSPTKKKIYYELEAA